MEKIQHYPCACILQKNLFQKLGGVCVCVWGGGGKGGKGGKREEGLDKKTEGEVGLEVLTSDYFQMS